MHQLFQKQFHAREQPLQYQFFNLKLITTQYQNKVAQNILALYLMINFIGSTKLKIW